MSPIAADYHIHTYLCGHAEGKPEEYVEQAIKMGLREIGFSDHAPLLSHRDPSITMDFDDLPRYHQLVERLKKDYEDKIEIKIGIEADYLPGYEKQTRDLLLDYPYDYVIGSVHFINHWAFDNPDQIEDWSKVDVDDVYLQYYSFLRESAQSRLFDILGHVDLVKKFGHRAEIDMREEIEKTASVFKEAGVAIEINTSGLRKPVREIYPAPDVLSLYCQAGVPVVFGSDSHRPREVGQDFDKAFQLAKSAGYHESVLFSQRKVTARLPFPS